jgi:hypothetical protein
VGDAKQLIVKPISVQDARRIITALHYSGKFDPRSKLHYGIFMDGKCGGAMQLGDPIDKRKALNIVKDTPWNSLLDLHRLAFADWLPRNGESRCIAYMMRHIRKTYPWIQWVQSYADATQCGDGTIYRASGFHLIGIKENASMYRMPDGKVCCKIVFEPGFSVRRSGIDNGVKSRYGKTGSETSTAFLKKIGATQLPGFQLRYIYFLDPTARERLTVPILPFSEIARRGAGMYRGKPKTLCAGSDTKDTAGFHPAEGGSTPTPALQSA